MPAKIHGHSSTDGVESPTYRSWRAMSQRCSNPNDARWNDYGGRGIGICPFWGKFVNFLADMGERPEGTTLDRIDVDDDYGPSNCRWATTAEQVRNTRRYLAALCVHGHEYTSENTGVDKNGHRFCRECHRLSDERRRRAKGTVAMPHRSHSRTRINRERGQVG